MRFSNFKEHNLFRLLSCSAISRCKKKELEDDEDQPIKYSTSKAAKWRAEVSRSGDAKPSPWFQPYVISLSLSVFMIYFFILREENDIDREFDKSLYERLPNLEEKQLEIVLKYNLENNLPVKDIKDRLEEIRK